MCVYVYVCTSICVLRRTQRVDGNNDAPKYWRDKINDTPKCWHAQINGMTQKDICMYL